MAIDPIGAILQTLAEWLEGQDGISRAQRGWPEREEDLDLSAGPVVSMTIIGDPAINWYPPVALSETLDGSNVDVIWGLADLSLRIQLDLWCPYRAVRDELAIKLNAALHDDLPWSEGLELTVALYYDQIASLIPRTNAPQDDETATREWRQRLELEVGMDLVAPGRTPAQAAAVLKLTTTLQGLDAVEPDFTISEE